MTDDEPQRAYGLDETEDQATICEATRLPDGRIALQFVRIRKGADD